MIGIYAGRFQPFHLGHFETIKHILTKTDELYILICSKVGNELDDKNPFTYTERMDMMNAFKDKVHFRHICDQESNAEWTRIIEETLPKGRKVCFTNNPRTKEAFESSKFEVNAIPIQEGGVSATFIRKLIIRNEIWKTYVPWGTITVIDRVRDV